MKCLLAVFVVLCFVSSIILGQGIPCIQQELNHEIEKVIDNITAEYHTGRTLIMPDSSEVGWFGCGNKDLPEPAKGEPKSRALCYFVKGGAPDDEQ
ncbi:unnamed protein product [Cylicocyclus nassatus]|uniref:Uncharacterized protein n=1 Tax=Cylicocyclus nassatus TaxID=53992 RepID=A0AA36GG34_CYLNA|nr:unnamed protein product [Cylicocyclus nassatus]